MVTTISIPLEQVAAAISLRQPQVEAVVELLDAGNTVPFITRYRKDQTGGLDEEQIREIQERVTKLRQLAERKQTILRSIESQGRLTPELAALIEAAQTSKRLEDLYLPFKPKKQTLATAARQRGLEILANEILNADPACANLDARAADFVNPDKGVPTAAEALLGAGHILAETFSERADVRQALRDILHKTGKLVTSRTGEAAAAMQPALVAVEATVETAATAVVDLSPEPTAEDMESMELPSEPDTQIAHDVMPDTTDEAYSGPADQDSSDLDDVPASPSSGQESTPGEQASFQSPQRVVEPHAVPGTIEGQSAGERPSASLPLSGETTGELAGAMSAAAAPTAAVAKQRSRPPRAKGKPRDKARDKAAKDKEREARLLAFRDYFDYSEALGRVPPHRVLAINRGENGRALRVRVESDIDAMRQAAEQLLVPPAHPHADFLTGCAHDALTRLVLPSLEREVRREQTDRAEVHAVQVFARNLRNLLLQPPVRNRRVLAIDPGYKSGCKLVALDEFGKVLEHGVFHLIGSEEKKAEGRKKVVDFIDRFQLTVVAIGNGTACRDTEVVIAELIQGELKDKGVAYVIVNEAGASVYSTSNTGREEFPEFDATVRGAISIGRRLQDPLSELVKIDAANIGVGLYQHDVKAAHLRASLDEVVESCVNYVGVDLNTASAPLLRYVSGLNQLTSRRLFDYRTEKGPFKSRDELKGVPGFGEATFVQAAGFLRISGAENPLDGTWIHPESYDAAKTVLDKLGGNVADLADNQGLARLAEKAAQANLNELANQVNLGTFALKDIVAQLARPGRDPREDLPQPIFKREILKLEDLTSGMELRGNVLNVVDFGAFVDIGLKDSGLVHISRLSRKFVPDPHQVVSVGDIVRVWVVSVDKERRRVSLTMIEPGTETPPPPRRPQRPEGQQRPPQHRRPPAPVQHGGAAANRKPAAPVAVRPKPKPRPPAKPLTKDMKEGKAPLRTFGDLKQFFDLKKEDKPEEEGDA